MNNESDLKLTPVGKMAVLRSQDIRASHLGVGCETLDRDYFDPGPVFPQLGDLGVKWARLQTGWFKCEKTSGVYTFAWLDAQVDELLALGIQPWFNIGYGNPLYTPEAAPSAETAVGKVPLNTPEAEAAWLAYVQALVAHFCGRINVYEIWNEPDHPKFWANIPIAGAQYARLFEPTAAAIREVFPKARIAALALTGGALSEQGRRFTREFFETIKDPAQVDIVSFHSYRYPPDRAYPSDVGLLKDLVYSFNPKADLWQGESGYPSKPGGTGAKAHNDTTSETIQAKWLSRHVLCNLGIGIRHVSWHQAIDLLGYREPDKVNPKGLLRAPGATRKPSFEVYQRLCAIFDDQTVPCQNPWNAQIPERTSDYAMPTVTAFQFTRGQTQMLAYWRSGDIGDNMQAAPLSLWVKGSWETARLLDPLTGTVYSVTGSKEDDGYRFQLPLSDYALILTTQS